MVYQGIHLITEQTPNGKKVQIMLEELKEVYGTPFTTSLLNLDASNPEQNKEWFLRLNPNGQDLHSIEVRSEKCFN